MKLVLVFSLFMMSSLGFAVTAKSNLVIGDIYCEAFGKRPDVNLAGNRWETLNQEYQDLYENHLRKFIKGEIDLINIMSDVKSYKENADNAPSGECQTLRGSKGKNILAHYNDLHALYCSELSDAVPDYNEYFLGNLFNLYIGRESVDKLKVKFQSAKEGYKRKGEVCSGYTARTLESAEESGELTLNFEYLTREELYNPLNRYASYQNTPACDKKLYFDSLVNTMSFNEELELGIKSCLSQVQGESNYKCFAVDIRTKNRERECAKIKDDLKKSTCIADARDKGNSDLLKLGCKDGIKGQGNTHVITQLTGLKMESFCPLEGSPETLNLDELNGHPFYGESRKDIHVKLSKCLKQTCYDSKRKWYAKHIEQKKYAAKTCKEKGTVSFHCYVYSNSQVTENICQTGVDLGVVSTSHPKMKEVVTQQQIDLAKRFGGLYVNNMRISLGKPEKSDEEIRGWLVYNLDTKGEVVSASLSATQRGDEVNYRPKVDTNLAPVFTDYNKFHLAWAGNVFNPVAKSMFSCPVKNEIDERRRQYKAYNADIFFQAKILGCVSNDKVDTSLPACDQQKIVNVISDIGVKKSKLLSATQIWLSGHENPALTPTDDSVLGLYPACKASYSNVKDIFSKEVEVSEEEKELIATTSESFQKEVSLVKAKNFDKNAVKKELNNILNSYFNLKEDTIKVPAGNGELENSMVYEVKAYEQDPKNTPVESAYQRFDMGINKLEKFRSDLKALYCSKLGVDVDLDDKYFLEKFVEASQVAFRSSQNLDGQLVNVEQHFDKEIAKHANTNDKSWKKNRKACR